MTKLGQHFLISKKVARRIVEVANVTKNDVVLEIGPGKGMLTDELLKRAQKVVAIEKDPVLCKFLEGKFKHLNHFSVICADIRDILSSNGIPWINISRDALENKVVANIPYYLTGQILRLLLPQSASWRIGVIVLMMQKEVAQRIVANKLRRSSRGSDPKASEGKMSLLAISVQVFVEPKIAFYVSKKHFRPQPKVDSAVIILKKRPKDFFKEHKIKQEDFFKLVKTGFAHKRKFLMKNLAVSKGVVQGVPLEELEKLFNTCGIMPKARAENLSLENWACLAKHLKS